MAGAVTLQSEIRNFFLNGDRWGNINNNPGYASMDVRYFKYDAMNRQVVVNGVGDFAIGSLSNLGNDAAKEAHLIEYDGAG